MPQSLAQIYTHIVFSTKKRQPLLTNEDIRNAMHAYLTGTCNNQDSPPLAVGGAGDHVHILCRLSKNLAIARLIKELKVDSSKWVKTKHADLATFQWQQGYGAFSVSPSHVDELSLTQGCVANAPGPGLRPFHAVGVSLTQGCTATRFALGFDSLTPLA